MPENDAFTLAHRRVHSYADDVMRLRGDAMQCRNCEEHLQKGIDAYKWIRQGEDFMREADSEGILEFTKELRDAFDLLYEEWLAPCQRTEEWVTDLLNRGYRLDNLEEFRKACDEVREIIERRDWLRLADDARASANSQESIK